MAGPFLPFWAYPSVSILVQKSVLLFTYCYKYAEKITNRHKIIDFTAKKE
jgi:hypothetical protein